MNTSLVCSCAIVIEIYSQLVQAHHDQRVSTALKQSTGNSPELCIKHNSIHAWFDFYILPN